MSDARLRRWTAAAVLGVLVVTSLLASPAQAQDGDPYGGTTTTTAAPVSLEATCDLSVTEGEVGTSVTATVFNVPFGGTVRVLFGGVEVGRATAPLQGQSVGVPVLFDGAALPRQATTTTVAIPFVVPDVGPGLYLVTAVGVDFTCFCSPETGGNFKVLGAVTGGPKGGSLPRTGIYVALLLVVALLLLLIGRALLEASRRRRAAEAEARPTGGHFADHATRASSRLK